MYRIAVSIITHNRYEVFKKSYDEILKYLPENADLFIVDDGSEIPVKEATFRFEKSQGIAAAKNKAFELAHGYDYHFAFDDDVYPIKNNWHLEYINTGLNHLCFSFDKFSNGRPNGRKITGKKGNIIIYHEPCGCMNFYTKACFDKVGGMDVAYGKWSYEHVAHSMRIYNAGLTPHPFMDIENSLELFYSYDWDQTTFRSVDVKIRKRLAILNERKYKSEIKSSKFIPYMDAKGIVLTSYFTNEVDPQKGEKWTANIDDLRVLIDSCVNNNIELVVINDCFNGNDYNFKGVKFVQMFNAPENPYFQRWMSYLRYLADNKHENIWMVDATDVEVLKNPFNIIHPDIIYCGWEREKIGCAWMKNHHKSNFIQNFIKCNLQTNLLNAGVVGGSYNIVMEFLEALTGMHANLRDMDLDKTDMPLFNWTIYSHFLGRFKTGIEVTTEFKKFQTNKISLFRHK